MTGSSRRRGRGEAGTTLVELLVTIVIMGIAFTTLIGGTFTMVSAGDRHRKQATAETVLLSFAEAIKAAPYEACSDSAYEGTYTRPDGFAAEVVTCATDGLDGVAGVQLLELKVESTDPQRRAVETLEIVKRAP